MSENITINLEGLRKRERKQLLKLVEKAKQDKKIKKVWKPELGESYWFIKADGQVIDCVWENDHIDLGRLFMRNCFRTKEEAEFVREKQKVKVELQRFADEHNDPDKLEWDGHTLHHVLVYDYSLQDTGGLSTCSYCTFLLGDIVYFTSAELAMEAVESIGEKRILKYMFNIDCEDW